MRLDVYLKERDVFRSRTRAQQAVKDGRVTVNGKSVSVSYEVKEGDRVEINAVEYASRGGEKLRKAFLEFPISVAGLAAADLGASNGGFTEVLLECGARRVYAVDVGTSQLDEALAGDARVTVMDKTNARNLTAERFPEKIGFVTADLSFISLKLIFPAVRELLAGDGTAVVLVKPQFEAGKGEVGKGGIVKDAAVRKRVLRELCDFAFTERLTPFALTNAPFRDGKNAEYLLALAAGEARRLPREYVDAVACRRQREEEV